MTSAAASILGRQLSEVYLENVFLGFTTLGDQLGTAADGARQLADGASSAADGAAQLPGGITQLGDGASQLASGAGTLAGGLDQIASGIGGAQSGATQLAAGVNAGPISSSRRESFLHSFSRRRTVRRPPRARRRQRERGLCAAADARCVVHAVGRVLHSAGKRRLVGGNRGGHPERRRQRGQSGRGVPHFRHRRRPRPARRRAPKGIAAQFRTIGSNVTALASGLGQLASGTDPVGRRRARTAVRRRPARRRSDAGRRRRDLARGRRRPALDRHVEPRRWAGHGIRLSAELHRQ